MGRTKNYSKAYNTVSQPGTSLATGFFSGLNENMQARTKAELSLAPKIMELQGRYGIEQVKQGYRSVEAQDKRSENDKRDLQKQLKEIQKFYKNKKFSIQEKIANALDEGDSGDLFGTASKLKDGVDKPENPKVSKLKELYSQVEESEQEDIKDILDQLRKYYR